MSVTKIPASIPGAKQSAGVKKVSSKKGTSTKNKNFNYEDKSAGQPELVALFDSIRALMKPYVKGTIKERGDKPGIYNLVSEKAIEVEGRKRPEVYFVTIMIQKGFVGFYYMLIYMNDPLAKFIHPDLLKCLKGKACFHIKKHSAEIMEHINTALKVGYDAYKDRGWV